MHLPHMLFSWLNHPNTYLQMHCALDILALFKYTKKDWCCNFIKDAKKAALVNLYLIVALICKREYIHMAKFIFADMSNHDI